MSVLTSVIVSIGVMNFTTTALDSHKVNRAAIQTWLDNEGHGALYDVSEFGGGEKVHPPNLFLGTFNCFPTQEFIDYVRSLDWPEPESVQILVMEIDREDSQLWVIR